MSAFMVALHARAYEPRLTRRSRSDLQALPCRATLTAVDAGMNTSKPAMIGFMIVKASAGR